MSSTITVTLPDKMKRKLDVFAKKEHLKKSDVVRSALNRFLAQQEFKAIRDDLVPEAQKRGFFTDEDVFKVIS